VNDQQALIPEGVTSTLQRPNDKIYFEDLDFCTKPDPDAKNWCDKLASWIFPGENGPWSAKFVERFAVVSDNTFNFLCEMATEVNTRIRIDPDRKIVASGALWTEESLPAETILAGMVWCDKVYVEGVEAETLIKNYCTKAADLQVGGKATIGKGQVRFLFTAKVEGK